VGKFVAVGCTIELGRQPVKNKLDTFSYCKLLSSVFGDVYSPVLFFCMLLAWKTANTDLPPIGFCIEFLLGSKYAGHLLLCLEKTCLCIKRNRVFPRKIN
jgi:hypothetical protein